MGWTYCVLFNFLLKNNHHCNGIEHLNVYSCFSFSTAHVSCCSHTHFLVRSSWIIWRASHATTAHFSVASAIQMTINWAYLCGICLHLLLFFVFIFAANIPKCSVHFASDTSFRIHCSSYRKFLNNKFN